MDIREAMIKALRKRYEAVIEEAKATAEVYLLRPVGKIREALKDFKYQANLCAAIINHANSVGKKLEDDIKKMIQTI